MDLRLSSVTDIISIFFYATESLGTSAEAPSSRGSGFPLICHFHRYWAYSSKSTVRPKMESCFQDEFLITKVRLKLKKVGKTTRPFRYDLNQIPYNYTVEVTNRFKGLDLIECLMK